MARKKRRLLRDLVIFFISLGILIAGFLVILAGTLKLPDLDSFDNRKISQSTKIYDRTGEILLFDVHQNVKRTVVPYQDISLYLKNATVAIEDAEFYIHKGIKISSILRAIVVNLTDFGFSQGGSTITQQVIKNSFLTSEKKISRKLKEWILAPRLEKVLTKDEILGIYLNEAPYGGNIYGVEEASRAFFSKTSSEISLAEAAYIAALPQAPTYYSPYGNNKEKLDERKNLVLKRMLEETFISQQDYEKALKEKVEFNKAEERGIKAPHFVIYVREYLASKYGEKTIEEKGLKVITTLDYDLQKKAEEITEEYALQNVKKFNATNASLVAVDPKSGQILVMVGSRNYFDKEIDGNFNVTLAHRQPGSAFKPFVYAAAFKKGYTPETVIFDLETNFSSECTEEGKPKAGFEVECYVPVNYDDSYRGPITFRNALAQSVNIPAIKVLYLAGISDSLRLAEDMGISSLSNANQYGLTLVLGGGEVSLLDITSAYSVFANNGVRNPYKAILRIEDKDGNILETYQDNSRRVLDEKIALTINNILSDNVARTPLMGPNSTLYFANRDVAAKTGTTNDYRDVWVIGYSPNLSVGAWAGNNDNTSIDKKTAGLVITPMWNAFMQYALTKIDDEKFKKLPDENSDSDKISLKPALKGVWTGGQTYLIDKISGKLATEFTPNELREERVIQSVHSILHWLDKNDPTGEMPKNPKKDPQYEFWEYSVRKWAEKMGYADQEESVIPTDFDDVHKPEYYPKIIFNSPKDKETLLKNEKVLINLNISSSKFKTVRADYFVNGKYLGFSDVHPYSFSFMPSNFDNLSEINELKAVVYDEVLNKGEAIINFSLSD